MHRKVVGSGRTSLLADLVTAMAPLEPALLEADWRLLTSEVTRLSRHRGLVVLLTPLEPGQSMSFSAIFEVPDGITELELVVTESTAARSARARIPLDQIEPAAAPAPVQAAQARDLADVLDRKGPLRLGTLCAASSAFPRIRQGLIDRAREVRAVEGELEFE